MKIKKIVIGFAALLLSIPLINCSSHKTRTWHSKASGPEQVPEKTRQMVETIISHGKNVENSARLSIAYPYDRTVFPPEIVAPEVEWTDADTSSERWLVSVEFGNGTRPVYALTNKQHWAPDKKIWDLIKANSVDSEARITVYGFEDKQEFRITGKNSIRIFTSKDPVDASIFYRQVPLPFKVGKKHFKKMRWRLGDISSYEKPSVVMKNLPVCASCHLFSKDGKWMSMEMNFKGDSGAHLITKVRETINLSERDFISWNDFPKPELLPNTRGLFAKMSPSGKYMVSTIHEISYAAVTNNYAFSQLFFPTYGVLAWYSTDEKKFALLPGADDYGVVQTDPSWSWDGKKIAFSRAETKNQYHDDIANIRTHVEDADIHQLNARFSIQFDLYQVPFNKGKGGKAVPVRGACRNGMSNYFPRYSPDGRWIVFTQSRTGIMLQPDSKLFIIPAQGGEARKMQCNRALFNSWHSFSPNGKWMLFTSKVNTPFTEIFLTHIDENGMDTPPVCLSRFSDENFAANVPEFVNIGPTAIKSIRLSEME
jgi:hypothetical protein